MKKKINIVLLTVGIFIIIISTLNYLMNEDHVSLGIFIFAGIGIILYSIKDYFTKETTKRVLKYSMTFFFGALIIFLYWLAKVQFKLF